MLLKRIIMSYSLLSIFFYRYHACICMRLIKNRMACSVNLGKIALGQLKNVKIALAMLRQFFYIFI